MVRYLLYGRDTCPFCNHAEDYFISAGLEYHYLNMSADPAEITRCKEFFGRETVPIILENCLATGKTKMIGGYSDLMKYVSQDE